MRAPGRLDQVTDLLTHDVPSADRAAQHRLVHDHPQGGRLVARQDLPPLQAGRDLFVDLLVRHTEAGPENGPRVVLGLEQARHQQRLEPAEFLRLSLAGQPVLEPGRVGLVAEPVADLLAEPGQRAVRREHPLQVFGDLGGGRALAQLDGLN